MRSLVSFLVVFLCACVGRDVEARKTFPGRRMGELEALHVGNKIPQTTAKRMHLCPRERLVVDYRCLRRRWLCVGTGIFRYVTEMHCCPGYAREPGLVGCPRDLYTSNKTLLEAITDLGLTKFAGMLNQSDEVFLHRSAIGPLTVFAPKDSAFGGTTVSISGEKIAKEVASRMVQEHVVEGKMVYHAIKTNQLLQTMAPGQTLRAAWAPDRETLVIQGAIITSENKPFRNGIIHVINHVIKPSLPATVTQYLHGTGQFTTFASLMRKLGTELTGHVTVFAPSDQAFERIHRRFLQMVTNNVDCLKPFVNFHIVERSLYTGGIRHRVDVTSRNGYRVHLTRHASTIIIEESLITTPDVTLKNGIVHVISDVMIAPAISFLGPFDLAKIHGARKFADFVRSHNLKHIIAAAETGPYTLLAPSDHAMELASDVISHMTRSKMKLEAFVRRHLLPKKLSVAEMHDGDRIRTMARTNRTDEMVTVNWYSNREILAVGGACVTRPNREVCSGVTHIINRVILPTTGTVSHSLVTRPRFKLLTKALRAAKLDKYLQNTNAITLFAPSDKAFRRLGKRKLFRLMKNVKKLRRVLLSHMVSGVVYSCMLRHDKLETLTSKSLRVVVSGEHMKVNGIVVRMRDLPATNGVIYELDAILSL
ncbi:transforming growth factor-beta-induced protein ig-h3 [Nematostella vectensis]|uniref:transforming growth factor-beta-induced protein ig-h3 n=1 Tax=Nematostella vectensis TaxID=45351 RepID=UPI002076DC0F|nr:transforming growth factor-beta-induced protein ig-h3 [Nematostella vectensis]